MSKLQPLLVPYKGCGADLMICKDDTFPNSLAVYWGTAILQRVPRDSDSFVFKFLGAWLFNLRFRIGELEKCFGVTAKTLRRWGGALASGDMHRLHRAFSGPGAQAVLSADQEQYVRVRYRELKATCRNYRITILKDLKRIWGVSPSGECLRRLFREEDELAKTGHCVESVDSSINDRDASSPVDGITDGELLVTESTGDGSGPAGPSLITDDRCQFDAMTDTIPPTNSKFSAQVAFSVSEDESKLEEHEGCKREAPDIEFSSMGKEREHGCASSPSECPCSCNDSPFKKENGLPGPSDRPWGPFLSGPAPQPPEFSHHAGLLILAPWLVETFSPLPALIRQFAAQILLGSVNFERSKLIHYKSLSRIIGELIRTPRHQSIQCRAASEANVEQVVWKANAALLGLARLRIVYFDPHTEEYTGQFQVLKGWCGALHGVARAIHLDFIHTAHGHPCLVRHFDNFEDMRQRFFRCRSAFISLLCPVTSGFIWVIDRGIWSLDVFDQIAALKDFVITWEKNYTKSAWNEPTINRGKFTRWRYRNSRRDRRRYRFYWHEQVWDKLQNGRRFIVRAVHPSGRCIEVSIVTNAIDLLPEQIIWLMFNRWLQENDFAYLGRHFGIGELSGRGSQPYAELIDELDDREVESRAHKKAIGEKGQVKTALGRQLVHLHQLRDVPSVKSVRAEWNALSKRAEEVKHELERLTTEETPCSSLFKRLVDTVDTLKARLSRSRKQHRKIMKRREHEQAVDRLTKELREIEDRLKTIPKTESRVLSLAEDGYVRLNLTNKHLMDAIRVTSRNVFMVPFRIFRACYGNLRDDHVIFRQMTRSSGFIQVRSDRMDVYLMPSLELSAAQHNRVQEFLRICEHRFRHAFQEKCPPIRFHFVRNPAQVIKKLYAQQPP